MGPQQQPYPPMFWPNVGVFPNSVPMFGQVQVPTPTVPGAITQTVQPQQVSQQPTFVQGRVVESEADIKPNEIPMDGSVTFFPKSDYTVVFGKTWTENGTIRSMRFLLEQENAPPAQDKTEKQEQSAINEDVIANVVQQIVQNQFQSFIEQYINPMNDSIAKLKPATTTNLIV